jgi:hypothetical protein
MVFSFLKKLASAPQPVKAPKPPPQPKQPEVSLYASNAVLVGTEYTEVDVMGRMEPVTHLSYFQHNAIFTARMTGVIVPFIGREAITMVWGEVTGGKGPRLLYVVNSNGGTYEPLGMVFLHGEAKKMGCINTETYRGFADACRWIIRNKIGVSLNL